MTISRIAASGLAVIIAARAAPVLAQPAVMLDSAVFVEKTHQGAGEQVRSLEAPSRLSHGDRVVTIVTWYKLGGDGSFTVTNPLPRALAYQGSAEDGEEVSVDGGRHWGRLGTLRIGTRYATPEDVTHVRWRVTQARAASGSGRIAYSAIVR